MSDADGKVQQDELDRQVSIFLSICGETDPSPGSWRIYRYMMEDITYWRERALNPPKNVGGRPRTRPIEAIRYKHLMGYMTDKLGVNQEQAAEIIARNTKGLDNWEREAATILTLAAGWTKLDGYGGSSKLFVGQRRYEQHAEFLQEISDITGNPEYFPAAIRSLDVNPSKP